MRILLTATLFVLLNGSAFSQKTAHINTTSLVALMPEKFAAEEELSKLKIEMESLLNELITKYTKLAYEIEQNSESWSAVIVQMKKNELIRMEQAIQDAKIMAENEFAVKEQELVAPILEKAMDAIQRVADQRGYDYVIDTAAGNVLVSPKNHDILDYVLVELGINN